MASNFEFLPCPTLKTQAQRIEQDLQSSEYPLAAQGLRCLLEGYIRNNNQLGSNKAIALAGLMKESSLNYRFNDNVWALMNSAAHGNIGEDTCTPQLITQALEEIHSYMRRYPPKHKRSHIPPFDKGIYTTEPTHKQQPKAELQAGTNQPQKELDIRPIQLPTLDVDTSAKAFHTLQNDGQMQKLAQYFNRQGLRDKVEQELSELLHQIDEDCQQNFPYSQEQQSLEYYSNLSATEFVQELWLETQSKTAGTSTGTWQQIPTQAQKAWQAELEQWQKEAQSQTEQNTKQNSEQKQTQITPQTIQQVAKHKQQTLQNYMLQQWFSQFARKRDQWLQQQIDAARKKYLAQLQKQMEQFEKLRQILEPFGHGLGRLWDMSKGELKNINWDILKHYEELLQREQSLKELANLLGRYRKAESNYEKQLIEVSKEILVQKSVYGLGGQRIGLEYGNNLNRVVPKEWLTLTDEDSELLFLLKYSQKRLLQYKTSLPYFDKANITSHKEEQHAKETDQGPFILCVDTSGSMHGLPEQTAKMLCYVLARFAAQSKRKLFLINFSTSIECLDLSSITYSLGDLIKFLCMSFHGGTDITPAMRKAVEMMNQESYRKADLLLISDGLFPSLSAEDLALVERQKQQDSKFYSLMIGSSALPNSLNVFDENWSYNLGESYEHLVEKIRFSLGKETLKTGIQNKAS